MKQLLFTQTPRLTSFVVGPRVRYMPTASQEAPTAQPVLLGPHTLGNIHDAQFGLNELGLPQRN